MVATCNHGAKILDMSLTPWSLHNIPSIEKPYQLCFRLIVLSLIYSPGAKFMELLELKSFPHVGKITDQIEQWAKLLWTSILKNK